jgi:adenylate cyclase
MVRYQKAIALGLVVGALGAALRPTRLGLRLEEDVGLRSLFTARGPLTPPPDVVVVTIDKGSAQQLGLDTREWPPPRHVHARVIRALAPLDVAAIVMDIRFEKHRSPIDDDDLAAAISASGNVALAQHIDRLTVPGVDVEIEQIHSPIDQLQRSAISLAPFPLPEGSLTHFFWTFFGTAAGEVPTLPAVGLQIQALPVMDRFVAFLKRAGMGDLGLPSRVTSVTESRQLMDVLRRRFGSDPQAAVRVMALLDAGEGRDLSASERRMFSALLRLYAGSRTYYLNFYGPAGTIETIPFHELLRDERPGRFALAGKVVFVGEGASEFVTSADQPDTFRTVYSTSEGFDLSGAEIGATALANLLTDRVLRPINALGASAILLGLGIVVGMLARLLPGIYAVPIVLAVSAAYYGSAQFLFSRHALLIPVVIPLLVQFPLALFVGVFSRYRDIRKQIPLEIDPNAPLEEFQGVCLATDIHGYTSLSERMEEKELASLLSEYYDTLRAAVERRGGIMVGGRAGDSSMNLWKPTWRPRLSRPHKELRSSDKELRLKACLAAIEMREAVDRFNDRHEPTRQLPTRFGLDASKLVFGALGREFQAVGEPTSTAARIQALNDVLKTRILVSERVVQGLEGLVLRPLGTFPLKGKAEEVPLVELLGESGRVSEPPRPLCERFAAGVALYRDGNYRDAANLFQQLQLDYPGDGPTDHYVTRCSEKLRLTPATAASPSGRVDTK